LELLLLVLFAAALWGIIMLAGRLLPESYTAEVTETVQTSPGGLWAILVNHAQEKEWRHDLQEIERQVVDGGHAVWKEIRRDRTILTLKTVESVPQKRLVREIVGSDVYCGRHIYEIVPGVEEGSCRLTIRHEIAILKPFARFKFYVFSSKDAYLHRLMADIRQRVVFLKNEE